MEVLKSNPSPELRFAVNSNLGMNEETLERMIAITHELPIKEMDVYTSNESYGIHAEYIRDGLVYQKWRSNLVAFLERAKLRSFTIMMTINSLCLYSITDFLDDMIELKKKYGANKPNVDLNILRWPSFMSPLALPDEFKKDLPLSHSTDLGFASRSEGRKNPHYLDGLKSYIFTNSIEFNKIWKEGVKVDTSKSKIYHYKSEFKDLDAK
jgi:hypothetical protein